MCRSNGWFQTRLVPFPRELLQAASRTRQKARHTATQTATLRKWVAEAEPRGSGWHAEDTALLQWWTNELKCYFWMEQVWQHVEEDDKPPGVPFIDKVLELIRAGEQQP